MDMNVDCDVVSNEARQGRQVVPVPILRYDSTFYLSVRLEDT